MAQPAQQPYGQYQYPNQYYPYQYPTMQGPPVPPYPQPYSTAGLQGPPAPMTAAAPVQQPHLQTAQEPVRAPERSSSRSRNRRQPRRRTSSQDSLRARRRSTNDRRAHFDSRQNSYIDDEFAIPPLLTRRESWHSITTDAVCDEPDEILEQYNGNMAPRQRVAPPSVTDWQRTSAHYHRVPSQSQPVGSLSPVQEQRSDVSSEARAMPEMQQRSPLFANIPYIPRESPTMDRPLFGAPLAGVPPQPPLPPAAPAPTPVPTNIPGAFPESRPQSPTPERHYNLRPRTNSWNQSQPQSRTERGVPVLTAIQLEAAKNFTKCVDKAIGFLKKSDKRGFSNNYGRKLEKHVKTLDMKFVSKKSADKKKAAVKMAAVNHDRAKEKEFKTASEMVLALINLEKEMERQEILIEPGQQKRYLFWEKDWDEAEKKSREMAQNHLLEIRNQLKTFFRDSRFGLTEKMVRGELKIKPIATSKLPLTIRENGEVPRRR